jgi:KaiC/GvpD/RAD55 family RecA-like ATPase
MCSLFFILGDLGLTQEAFIAVNGELGTGETNVEWHFI